MKKKKLCNAGWPASPRAYAVRTRANILGAHLLCGPVRSNPFKNSSSRTGLNGPGWPAYPFLSLTHPSPPTLSVIHLTSDSSSFFAAPYHAPPQFHGRGFIRTCVVPRGRGPTRGGERGDDAPGGFGNGYLQFNG